MPMNKHPERTVNKILSVAEALFVKQGYYDTNMQDIIDALSPDLTKGAIYYHFKSRDDIFYRIISDKSLAIYSSMDEIIDRTDLNGREKFQMAIDDGTASDKQADFFNFIKAVNPVDGSGKSILVAYMLKLAEVEAIPRYKTIFREGCNDGSIDCKYPNELAELLAFLGSVWLTGKLGLIEQSEYVRKMIFVDKLFRKYGIYLVNDETREAYRKMLETTGINK